MYLVDKEILGRLADLEITGTRASLPFDASAQVQPCSIDLRLDGRYWKPARKSVVDLRKTFVDRVRPRRQWRAFTLQDGEYITLRPGQTFFGRVYESVTMPPQLAGKIEGRSSFGRLGLSVHCTSDFINPGWRGHMPLQLHNAGPFPIRITPYIPICQLKLIKLAQQPERLYGATGLSSKYVENNADDGGPSYWFRDDRISKLHDSLVSRGGNLAIEARMKVLTDGREVEILEKFQTFLEGLPAREIENADHVIERFAKRERRRKTFRDAVRWFTGGLASILVALAIENAVGDGVSWLADDAKPERFAVFSLHAALLVMFTVAFVAELLYPRTGYLLPRDLETDPSR